MTTQFLSLAEGRIAYDDTETDGPLVVLVPGIGDLRSEYRFVREPLAAAGYRVVTMDLRGHGASDATFSRYDGEHIGQDIIALLNHLDAGPATIMGCSIAAGAAVYAAAEAPLRVASIVLLGGFTRGPDLSWPTRLMVQVVMGGPWRIAAWMAMYDTLFPLAKPADHDEHRAAMRANFSETARSVAVGQMMRSNHHHAEARYDRVRCPSLFVMGTADPDFPDPKAEAEEVAAALGGTTGFVEGAGHYPHVEAPDVVLELVLPFLEAHSSLPAGAQQNA